MSARFSNAISNATNNFSIRHDVLGSTEDLLLNSGLRAYDKTWREGDFTALDSGERSSTSLVTPGMDPTLY